MLIPSGPMGVDDLASRIASLLPTGVKGGDSVNGNRWNCRLSSLGLIFLDISPVRRIGGGVN